MDYLQYKNYQEFLADRFESGVLNLVINGLPSILSF